MGTELTNAEKMRGLPWVFARDVGNTVFCHLTLLGTIFILFLRELGLDKTKMGLLLSLCPFMNVIAIFAAPTIARVGFKRVFLIFWAVRKTAVAFILLTPWVLSRYGSGGAFLFVAAIVFVFAVGRALAVTGSFPWSQELVPDSIRGKFTAMSNLTTALSACVAVGVASWVLGRSEGLGRFMFIMAVGVGFAVVALVCAFFVPGGAPMRGGGARPPTFREVFKPLKDENFMVYMGGTTVVMLAVSFLAFVPLFAKESIGLSEADVARLAVWSMMGGILSGMVWGWTSDRFGSKPVLLSGVHVMALVPVCWMLVPRQSEWSNPVAMVLVFLGGMATAAWAVSRMRLLYVNVVPSRHKTEYMAVYFALVGLATGTGRLCAGATVEFCKGLSGKFLVFELDAYTPIFVVSFVLMLVGMVLLRRVRDESRMRSGQFVGMFLQGKPLLAFESMLRFNLAGTEERRVSMTERLGKARSPLNIDELLEALSDPSFNVRYEAIVSIARTRPDARLVDALIEILRGGEPDLSAPVASALGRIGDARAIEPLREALGSQYPLLRARSARALGVLGDREVAPALLDLFRHESDDGLRLDYASSLGALRAGDAVEDMLPFLRSVRDEGMRMELSLALARIVGGERDFIRLWRRTRAEAGTATSQAVTRFRRQSGMPRDRGSNLAEMAQECAAALAENDLERGAQLLAALISALPVSELDAAPAAVLAGCAECLGEFGAGRIEYLLLAVHTMNTCVDDLQR